MTAHACAYPPHGDLLGRPDDRCVTCEQERPASRVVAVDEAFLRQALRDALCFAQYHATSGDPDSPQYIREYETALLELADAPAAWTVTRLSLLDALRAVLPFSIDADLADSILAALDAQEVAA